VDAYNENSFQTLQFVPSVKLLGAPAFLSWFLTLYKVPILPFTPLCASFSLSLSNHPTLETLWAARLQTARAISFQALETR
jgi:hypothetical protein